MKKSIFILSILLFLSCLVHAHYSDYFLLGANGISNLTATNDQVLQLIQEAHYNSVETVNWLNPSYQSITGLLNNLDQREMDSNVNDKYSYYTGVGADRSIEFLSTSNYFRFEEEYGALNTEVNTGDLDNDKFFYRFEKTPNVGSPIHDIQNVSNNAYWYCPYNPVNDSTWKVISGPMYWRWFYAPDTVVDECLTYMFKFAHYWNYSNPSAGYSYLHNNKLYISVALKWDDTNSNDDNLIKVDFLGITLNNEIYEGLDFQPEGNYEKILKVSDISSNLNVDPLHPNSGFRVFTYSIDLAQLDVIPTSCTQPFLGDHYALYYVVPIISWKQNRTVYLDYIEYEDDIHREMRLTPSSLDTWIADRLSYYNTLPHNNIISYMGVNEPYPGNFDSCDLVNDHLVNSTSSAARPLSTNHHLLMDRRKSSSESFSVSKCFNSYAHPDLQCLHLYPIRFDTDFNNPASSTFIQRNFQKMLDEYKATKETNMSFYPVTQTYGDWHPNDNPPKWWGGMYPDSTSQKCLQYLPLCYGPSGIINYAVYNNSLAEPVLINPDLSLTSNYHAIKSANEKILVYGPIVKTASWKGSECIESETGLSQDFSGGAEHFTSISMAGPFDSEPYHGYVQCGFFHSDIDNYYMLVNRRTAAFAGTSLYTDPYFTPVSAYKDAYVAMPSQTVELAILDGGSMISEYGPNPGLYDPYTKDIQFFQDGKAQITLEPGEASLRKIIAVLPTVVTDSLSINRDFYAIDDVNIDCGGVVRILSGTTLYLTQNKKIYVTNGSVLRIHGNLNASDSTQIIVESGSTLDLSNAVCQWGLGAGIAADSSGIMISSSTMIEMDAPNTWKGIICSNCVVEITNGSEFSDADIALELNNSSLVFESGSILVPHNGTGIKITGNNSNRSIHITGSVSDSTLIYSLGTGNREEMGIDYSQSSNHLVVDHTVFRNLYQGIEYLASVAHADAISNSTFNSCFFGIAIEGAHGLSSIAHCLFF